MPDQQHYAGPTALCRSHFGSSGRPGLRAPISPPGYACVGPTDLGRACRGQAGRLAGRMGIFLPGGGCLRMLCLAILPIAAPEAGARSTRLHRGLQGMARQRSTRRGRGGGPHRGGRLPRQPRSLEAPMTRGGPRDGARTAAPPGARAQGLLLRPAGRRLPSNSLLGLSSQCYRPSRKVPLRTDALRLQRPE